MPLVHDRRLRQRIRWAGGFFVLSVSAVATAVFYAVAGRAAEASVLAVGGVLAFFAGLALGPRQNQENRKGKQRS